MEKKMPEKERVIVVIKKGEVREMPKKQSIETKPQPQLKPKVGISEALNDFNLQWFRKIRRVGKTVQYGSSGHRPGRVHW